MTFQESIKTCFRKYAEFEGKASRSELWWFLLFVTLVTGAFGYVSSAVASIFLIAVLLPVLAVGSRRLRAVGKNSWWLLLWLIPFAGIIMLAIWWSEEDAK